MSDILSRSKVLYDRYTIDERIQELAHDIEKDYQNAHSLSVVIVLNGAVQFGVDLTKQLGFEFPINIEYAAIHSYGNSFHPEAQPELRYVSPSLIGSNPENILIIEDIIDTGYTIYFLHTMLNNILSPKSIKICTLINKTSRRQINAIQPDYVGFELQDDLFVFGYGMDYKQGYRNIPEVRYVVEK